MNSWWVGGVNEVLVHAAVFLEPVIRKERLSLPGFYNETQVLHAFLMAVQLFL